MVVVVAAADDDVDPPLPPAAVVTVLVPVVAAGIFSFCPGVMRLLVPNPLVSRSACSGTPSFLAMPRR